MQFLFISDSSFVFPKKDIFCFSSIILIINAPDERADGRDENIGFIFKGTKK
ncbi:MAG: hypothetical protein ACJAT4_002437 [Granulosicoccus sp.]|jgi:hypothetical protein